MDGCKNKHLPLRLVQAASEATRRYDSLDTVGRSRVKTDLPGDARSTDTSQRTCDGSDRILDVMEGPSTRGWIFAGSTLACIVQSLKPRLPLPLSTRCDHRAGIDDVYPPPSGKRASALADQHPAGA
jgi:hypothetical protein